MSGAWYARTAEEIRELLAQIRSGPPPAPDICGVFYRGKTHGLPGGRDAGKSLFMMLVALRVLKLGGSVLWIDHEVGARDVLSRFAAFAFDDEALAERLFLIDDARGLPAPETVDLFAGVDLVVLDAMTGQMASSDLDDNSAADVDRVYERICRPLAKKHGAAVVVIDHVPHGNGDRPLGSQRKSSAPDVELVFKSVTRFRPGHGGRAKIIVGRDRDGAIQPCEFVLEPDGAWRLEFQGEWQPTEQMQRVSEYLEAAGEPVSKASVERDVRGKSTDAKRVAMDKLVRQGYATASRGARNAILLTHVRLYVKPQTTSPDLASTSPGEVGRSTSPPRLTLLRGEDEVDPGEVEYLEDLACSADGYYDSIEAIT